VRASTIVAALLCLALVAILLVCRPSVLKIEPLAERPLYPFEREPYFLWTYRGLDVLIQVFIILATASAISSQFREEGPGVREEAVVEEGEG